MKKRSFMRNFGLALDRWINTWFGGHYDHTISGRVGYHSANGHTFAKILEKIINAIFFDSRHCKHAKEWDELKKSTKYTEEGIRWKL